ncbi:MAG: hypothetical protein CL389_01035 [Acidiferrobacteraceae bacterium]|jgi:hypothetical protein|nr:hypothetical protein [Acidiferrobacteraceae bacterium]MDP6399453.1 hypothetical protein [Arenicellales bacterium]HCY13416.1 hypothetical protein [Gammaproteobacteria bacterium]MDP6531809.1 hypothetical protein [Arenicellales bacterium]MDP6855734.1 hypothetical protein [Arenicellales bacterium]|tara:strand:+ start:52 stop:372 length:321 start_codon:yes stop_codon:yes gene_type:complete
MAKNVYELNKVYELNVAVEVGPDLALAGYCFFEAEDEQEAREKAVAYFDAHKSEVATYAARGPFRLSGGDGTEITEAQLASGATLTIEAVKEFSVDRHIKSKLLEV